MKQGGLKDSDNIHNHNYDNPEDQFRPCALKKRQKVDNRTDRKEQNENGDGDKDL